jgi:hypothetical protein
MISALDESLHQLFIRGVAPNVVCGRLQGEWQF